ncbi:hypothetical protein PU560_08500 [Georgenia sp. 10Sc9-8]|uniref:Uncharacterized protein n=1 Tax=Georgenia halotolerans TaxID=3028317 RepID=A0ABT5TWS4_9MICO|nr:hypothetical protein [Georgenia halotolerans]
MTSGDPSDKRRLYQQILEHPGKKAENRWNSLSRIHRVMRANEADLLSLIDRLRQEPKVALAVMSDVTLQDTRIRDAFFDEVIRTSHNYLSALKMLVEHTRNLMRHYQGTPFHEEYTSRVLTLVAGGRGPLLRKLRDYLIHYRVPPFGTVVELGQDIPLEMIVCLDRNAALEYPDWSRAAREYLEQQPDQIPLTDLIRGYASDLEQVYNWLYEQFPSLHGAEIAEVNEMIIGLQGAGNTPGHPDYHPPHPM